METVTAGLFAAIAWFAAKAPSVSKAPSVRRDIDCPFNFGEQPIPMRRFVKHVCYLGVSTMIAAIRLYRVALPVESARQTGHFLPNACTMGYTPPP
jgi:hypothetical protein